MKDKIAERNQKEKMEHSIIKWWNVHYMTPEELEAEQARESAARARAQENVSEAAQEIQTAQGELEAAEDILQRLQQEADADEARKRQEIEQAKQEAEANYNPTTGAYSGAYGAEGAKKEHSEQIEAILSEKDEKLRNLIEHTEET